MTLVRLSAIDSRTGEVWMVQPERSIPPHHDVWTNTLMFHFVNGKLKVVEPKGGGQWIS